MFFSHYAAYARALLDWREGRPAEAAAAMAATSSDLRQLGMAPFEVPMLLDLTEVAAELGDCGLAAGAAGRLAAIADEVDRDFHRAIAVTAATEAATATDAGDPVGGPGEDAARQAAGTLSDHGYPVLAARAWLALGRALTRTDRPAAIEALERAAASFQAAGATWRRDRALDALRCLPGRGKRAAGAVLGPGSLTRREREVAGLAAQGLTAREIADRLYIGERTVEGHLASVYAKLGVRSKVDLMRRSPDFGA